MSERAEDGWDWDGRGDRRNAIQMYRGDTLYFLDRIYQNPLTGRFGTARPWEPPPPGMTPYNLSGVTIWFTAKPTPAEQDVDAPIRLDNADLGGVTVISPAAGGTFSATAPPVATVSFPDGDVVLEYDVQIQDTMGNLFTVEKGNLTVVADITRALTPWIPGSGPAPAYGPIPGGLFLQTTSVTSSSYTVDSGSRSDSQINVNYAGAVGVAIPSSSNVAGRLLTVTDTSGAAGSHPITLTPATGTINGAPTYVVSTNRGSVSISGDATNWFVVNKVTS